MAREPNTLASPPIFITPSTRPTSRRNADPKQQLNRDLLRILKKNTPRKMNIAVTFLKLFLKNKRLRWLHFLMHKHMQKGAASLLEYFILKSTIEFSHPCYFSAGNQQYSTTERLRYFSKSRIIQMLTSSMDFFTCPRLKYHELKKKKFPNWSGQNYGYLII